MSIHAEAKMEIVEINLHSGKRINYYACVTLHALLLGDLESLNNLLQFGSTVKEYQVAIYNSKYLFSYVPTFDFRCRDDRDVASSTSPQHMDVENDDNENSRHLLRKSIVHEVIVFLLKYYITSDRNTRHAMVEGFHVVWRSRPAPYVKIQELFQVLKEDWINDKCQVKCGKMLERACNKYGSLFPKICDGVLTPRTLKHLGRCAVREKLMKSSWSFGVEKLHIPKKLKSYLLLEF